MTPEIANTALIFMDRVVLNGNQVAAFNQVVAALQQIQAGHYGFYSQQELEEEFDRRGQSAARDSKPSLEVERN